MDTEPLTSEANNRRGVKLLFSHGVVKALSIILIFVGVMCLCFGIASVAISLVVKCQFHPYNNYRYNRYDDYGLYHNRRVTTTESMVTTTPYSRMCSYYRTYSAPGIWCGLMYIACGIIGIVASKRKTICFVVTLMTLTVVSNWVALCGMVISVMSHFDGDYDQLNDYPVVLHVLDSVITLLSLIAFILQWIEFGLTCRSVCCNGKKGYPEMKKKSQSYSYMPLQSQAMTQPVPVMPMTNPGSVQLPPHGPETIYLVKNQQIIGVLPQNMQQVLPPHSSQPTNSNQPTNFVQG